ncbi:hypothetical protein [Hydrogenophaga sp. IBVHS1]|uniref:hypothetical protein n=1 Tax=unclassified Hydrogenophaga TaxID=2610897 RepID=UPI001179E853|nr:hypothetical protein [Hydrogenophaga sp. IBVHS1]
MLKVLLALASASLLTGCSKTANWEEEAPLNTGETIWVKRSQDYSISGDSGNPMDLGWHPIDEHAIEFDWAGKKYRYSGDARPMLLAIDNDVNQPVLVSIFSMSGSYYKANYFRCNRAYYVAFIYDPEKATWSPQAGDAPWLNQLKSNLTIDFHDSLRLQGRITAIAREQSWSSDPRRKSSYKVDLQKTNLRDPGIQCQQ